MLEDHNRWKVWNEIQHPLTHSLSDFTYTSEATGSTLTVAEAFDWLFKTLYPFPQSSVATPSDLPDGGTATITQADPAVVTLATHGYSDGDRIYLTTTDTLPTGLSADTNYYIVNSNTNTFQLSSTEGGSAIATTGAGSGTHTVNNVNLSYRVVIDDGDGKAASYRWEQREGEALASWHKIYDMDWGQDTILSQFLARTQEVYVYKWGTDDLDADGVALTGSSAGQHIYGGSSASTNLTLHANAGDGVGSQTGYVQVADNFRPVDDSTWSLGTTTERWLKVWTDEITSGTLTATSGSITDSSGAISFGDENLTTTGWTKASYGYFSAQVQVGAFDGDALVLGAGSITDESGAISFGDENLTTTGWTKASYGYFSDQVQVGAFDGDALILGAGSITDESGAISFGDENLSTTGSITGGSLVADNITIDGNTLSSTDTNGNIILDPNGSGLIEFGAAVYPETTSAWDIGKTGNVWNKLWIDGSIGDGSNEIAISTLLSLRSVLTGPPSDGDVLFYDSASGTWLPSAPDTEIDHGSVSGLSDDDHTQYALLAGRSGGQTLVGGTDASDDLTLESTSDGTKGSIKASSNFIPTTDASYSGGWSGTDLGGSSNYFRDLYLKGTIQNLRVQNAAVASIPASSAQNVGRLWYASDTVKLYIDTGSAMRKITPTLWNSDESFNGTDTSKSVTVSSLIADARTAIWQLRDNANNYEIMYVALTTPDAATVTITANPPLPSGSYRLVGIEI